MSDKIIFALKRKYHCEHTRSVLQQNALSYPVYELTDSDASHEILKRALSHGAQILITGDVYANSIMNQFDISVVTIRRSKIPFSDSIMEALKHSDHAAIVWREVDSASAKKACRAFENKVTFFPYQNHDDLDQIFRKIHALGCHAVIGAGIINPYAEKYGLFVVNVPYDESDILSALRIAEHNLRSLDEQKERAAILRTIQDNISEGIISIDRDGTIQTINHSAQRLLCTAASSLLNQPVLKTLIACPEIRRLVQNFEEFSGKILSVNGNNIVLEGKPIFVHSIYKSAILTMTPVEKLQHTEQQIRRQLLDRSGTASVSFSNIVGQSPALLSAIRTAQQYAKVDSSVLVYGQSGTGKEMFVQSIHNASRRKNGPFVVINCAALPESLIESELFGYEKGAFTGALNSGKQGLFVRGHQGTVFLDEISEMPLSVQARFLRVLQEHEVTPIGSPRVIPVDIRVIAATNRDLRELVKQKKFREDLYYRISILTMKLPSLAERKGDIPLLVQHFIAEKNRELGLNIQGIDSDAMQYFVSLPWPGNIRQLSNLVERSMVLCPGDVIDLNTVQTSSKMLDYNYGSADLSAPASTFQPFESVSHLQEEIIRATLRKNHNNRKRTAAELNISTSTLYRRMKELGIIV